MCDTHIITGHDRHLGGPDFQCLKHSVNYPPRQAIKIKRFPAVVFDQNVDVNIVQLTRDRVRTIYARLDRDVIDLLNVDPRLAVGSGILLTLLQPLQHRAYSIASSPVTSPGRIDLTVAAVRWQNGGRDYNGVCATMLTDLLAEGEEVEMFMVPNKRFRLPEDPGVATIMVGPGTGIAPFRAFLEERRERGATGANWLFFGDQHRADDFIYEDEIGAFNESGLLTRLDLAFSRDQADKIYVQHRMVENGKDLFGYLEQGGHFYVCGDATRMAKDVDAALHQIIETQGGMTPEAATDYVNRLKRDKRYVRDVY